MRLHKLFLACRLKGSSPWFLIATKWSGNEMVSRFITEVNTCSNHKGNEAKANEGDLQSNSFVNEHWNFCQHPMRPWNKGKSQKRELNLLSSILKWPCLANILVLLLVRKGSSPLAKSFPFFFLLFYHRLIQITYGRIVISPRHCPQTLRTSWKFGSRDVISSLIQPEHWSGPATLPCIILTHGCYSAILC